jgi:2-polyprenyl-3-methyl-5-hydroxy-6-metoxy-1,4-benzoquinol methylase
MKEININEKNGLFYNLLDSTIIYKSFQFLIKRFNTDSRLFRDFFVFEENAIILDCGCGPGTYRRYIKSDNYIGLDINKNHIEAAKQSYPRDTFFTQDLTKFNNIKLNNADVVLMIGILHHLDDKACINMFKNLNNIINPNGIIYTIDPVFIPHQRKIAKFLASRDKGDFVRDPKSYNKLVGSKYQVDDIIINNLLRLPYDHYFMKILKN